MKTEKEKYSEISDTAIASNLSYYANLLARKQSELAEIQHQMMMLHQESIRRYRIK